MSSRITNPPDLTEVDNRGVLRATAIVLGLVLIDPAGPSITGEETATEGTTIVGTTEIEEVEEEDPVVECPEIGGTAIGGEAPIGADLGTGVVAEIRAAGSIDETIGTTETTIGVEIIGGEETIGEVERTGEVVTTDLGVGILMLGTVVSTGTEVVSEEEIAEDVTLVVVMLAEAVTIAIGQILVETKITTSLDGVTATNLQLPHTDKTTDKVAGARATQTNSPTISMVVRRISSLVVQEDILSGETTIIPLTNQK